MKKWLFISLLVFGTTLCAQDFRPERFAHYTTADGLSHNVINGLAQDETGFIWITTPAGYNRFNGTSFTQYHSTSDSLSPASEDLNGIKWLSRNKLGVYSAGLHVINTKTGGTRNIYIPYYRKQLEYKFNMIVRSMGDQEGNVFILSRSGFYHFDKNDQLVFRHDHYKESDVPIAHFFYGRELLQLDNNRYLIISSGGLYIYNKQQKKYAKLNPGDVPFLDEFIGYPHDSRLFWQTKPGNIFIFKTGSDTVTYIDLQDNRKTYSRLPFPVSKNEIHYYSKLVPVNDSTFYLTGHTTGFYRATFDRKSGKVNFYPRKYFPNHQCNALLVARDNSLWVGTSRGLYRQDDIRAQVQTTVMPASIEAQYPNIIIHKGYVSGDKIYAGTRNTGNLLVFDKDEMHFEKNLDFPDLRTSLQKSLNVYSIIDADENNLLIGTDGPLFLVNKTTLRAKELSPPAWERPYFWTPFLSKDSRQRIWISSSRVYHYDHQKGIFFQIPDEEQLKSEIVIPEVIREDADGNMWMAGHGLSRYNMQSGKYDIRLDSFPFIKMPDKQVNALVIDKKRNQLWFNSRNNGLIGYDIRTGRFNHFTSDHGLPDNNVTALEIVDDRLWIAAYSGVASMELKDFKITGFGKEDGFLDLPLLTKANFYYDREEDYLYLMLSKAIAKFHPSQLLRKKSPPRIFIEELAISGRETNFLPAEEMSTSWKDNEIRLTIGTINFSDAGTQRFAYRIVGNDSTPWTMLGSQPSFSISNLSPGTHRIQVKTFSISNRWTEQISEMSLVVTPPFWMKGWFLSLVSLLVLGLIYLLIQWRTAVARREEKVKTHIERLKADDYKNQFELEQISNYFSSSLANKKSKDVVLWDVAQNLIGRMNYEDCVIYLWNADKTKMVQKAAYGPKGKPELLHESGFEVAPGQGIVGQVIKTRQPLLVNDTRKDPRYRVDDSFRCSEIAVPIIHNGELLGVLDSEHSVPGYFNDRDIKILTTIATLIGNKLTQIESEQSLEAKQRELAGINEQLAEARLSALQAQMNPHFVFNALNSIKRMILDRDNEKASRYLSKFALMIRMTLEHSKEVFVTLDENIEYLKAYLDMEKLRFDDSFTYTITTDENVDTTETFLPSMMIQPLVENAIWHGLMHASSNKKIKVNFSQEENKITCTVEDNGIGIQQSEKLREKHRPLHRSMGLENLQKRIKIMNEKYHTACTLKIVDLHEISNNGSGTRAVLEINSINT